MAYSVELADRSARDLRLLFLSIRADESDAAARWFNGMEQAIETLRDFPSRRAIAPDATHIRHGARLPDTRGDR